MALNPACALTHRLLAWGACPWCEQHFGDIRDETSKASPGAARARGWNVAALLSALESHDINTRLNVVENLLVYGPALDEALPVLSLGLNDSNPMVRTVSGYALRRVAH